MVDKSVKVFALLQEKEKKKNKRKKKRRENVEIIMSKREKGTRQMETDNVI